MKALSMGLQLRKVVSGALAAIICVLVLQIVFVFSSTFVRGHTDLAAVRAHITAGFRRRRPRQ